MNAAVMASESPYVMFDLPDGNRLEMLLRRKVTPQEFEVIKKIMDLSEYAFVKRKHEEDQGHSDAHIKAQNTVSTQVYRTDAEE